MKFTFYSERQTANMTKLINTMKVISTKKKKQKQKTGSIRGPTQGWWFMI